MKKLAFLLILPLLLFFVVKTFVPIVVVFSNSVGFIFLGIIAATVLLAVLGFFLLLKRMG